MNRRDFLFFTTQAGMAYGLSQFFPVLALAAPSRGGIKNLITVHINGGWDVILGLDPQVKKSSLSDRACFIGYRPDEIIRAGALSFAPPAAVLKPYANRCIVINGVSMLGNISHQDCTRMAQTGIIERRTPQLVCLKSYAERRADFGGAMILTSDNQIENGQLPISTVAPSDIYSLASGGDQLSTFILEPDGLMAQTKKINDLYADKMSELATSYPKLAKKLGINNSDGVSNNSTMVPAAVAFAFKAGYVSAAHITIDPTQSQGQINLLIDTHSSHKSVHPPSQANCWAQVVDLIETLKSVPGDAKGSSLFDETLIMVTSEFSRESSLNGDSLDGSGKEHNGYTNSYLLIGGRLKGGRTVGESVLQADMMGRPSFHTARNFDFSCGQVIRTGSDDPAFLASGYYEKKQITPGHVVRTIAENFGTKDLLDPTLKNLPFLPIVF